MRLIDADAYAAEMKKRQDACMDVMESDSYDGEQFSFKEHWEGVLAAFAEAKLTLDDIHHSALGQRQGKTAGRKCKPIHARLSGSPLRFKHSLWY